MQQGVSEVGFSSTERFEARGILGRGSMGIVHRVFDKELGREVALKALPIPDPAQLIDLKREFRAAASLVHPRLVELYELVQDEDSCFFTMELVEGRDIIASVRPESANKAGPVELERALSLIAQLAEGVVAIHDAGLLHRDIKPSNTMVCGDDRLVILDFGLAVTALANPLEPELGLAGTLVYMAPEQAWGHASTSADLYGVGAVAYEVLTGQPPFRGTAQQILQAKQRGAPSLRALAPSTPEWLDELVTRLLDPKPERRPSASELLDQLAAHVDLSSSSSRPRVELPFVGRDHELAHLRGALAASHSGLQSVHVSGRSGMGKTALIEHFVREVESRGSAVVLRSRCHPQELLPYKALDGVVDGLSRYLLRRAELLDEPLTLHTGTLLQLFPALRSVTALADLPLGQVTAEPVARRRLGARALRTFLTRIASDTPVVVWIDDLQWGDLDSLVLLRELVRPPAPPPMLLLLSYRAEELGTSPVLRELEADPLEGAELEHHELSLSALPPAQIRSLTTGILAQLGCELLVFDELDGLVEELDGSPLLAAELARHLASVDAHATLEARTVRLSDVIDKRIAALGRDDRKLLELIALAAFPVTRELVLDAAGIGRAGWHQITRLERLALLRRRSDMGGGAAIYHDRIAEVVVGRLDEPTLRDRHEALLSALEHQTAPDPEALVAHNLGAGRLEVAGRHAVRAGDRAFDALAFDRAAELYAIALRHLDAEVARGRLLIKRAEALAHAGRGGDSGRCYIEAAATPELRDDPAKIQQLRALGAEQLIRSGHLDEGLELQRQVLAEFHVRLPRTAKRAQGLALARRLWLTVRGLRYELRDADEIEPTSLRRLDALWSASTSLALMNFALADSVGIQHLVGALAIGERSRLTKALGYEAAFEAALGSSALLRRAERKLELAAAIAEQTGKPYDRAWVSMSRCSAMWGVGRWQAALEAGEQALNVYADECRGVIWEMSITKLYVLSTLAFRGHLRELSTRLDEALRDAIERGDLFAANNYRLGQMSIARLANDQVDEAFELAARAQATWPKTIYHTQHYHHAVLTVQGELYRRDPWAALARINAAIPGLEQAQLNFHHVPWMEILHLRARAALDALQALARDEPSPTPPDPSWTPARLRRAIKASARRVGRSPTPMAQPFATILLAALAKLEGNDEAARVGLERALAGFDDAEMALYREATRHRLGELLGGDDGARMRDTSMAWLQAQGVRSPTAMLAMLTPGF